jgi:Bacterial SH3 domain
VKWLLLLLCFVSAAMYVLASPRVPVREEAVTQAESNQRVDGPLRSSWGPTLSSLRQEPDTSAKPQETGSYRQIAAYEKEPDLGQTDPQQSTNAIEPARSINNASTTGADTRWARITLPATLHRAASVSSPIVGYSGPGKEVQIREYTNGWYRVQDPETEEGGWIFHEYLAYIHGPTPAPAQIAATAEPPVKVISPTSRKLARTAKVPTSADRKVKRHDRRVAESGKRWRGLGLFKRRQARRAWSLGPAY